MLIRSCTLTAVMLLATGIAIPQVQGQSTGAEIDLERTGIVYCIGRVDRIIQNSPVIDLGDAHTLQAEQQVAIFRPNGTYHTPLGILTIAETLPTSSQAYRSQIEVQVGDVVMFVRELSELKTAAEHRDEFLKQQIIKNSGANSYSTRDNTETARTLLAYSRDQPKWEKRKTEVLGYLNGASFAEGGEKRMTPLLNQINQFRKQYRSGRNSLIAAGPQWSLVMQPLLSRTAKLQHNASQVGNADDDLEGEPLGPSTRDITRLVNEQLFDRTEEERNLFCYMVATALEQSPDDLGLWVRQQAEQSQFPQLPSEDVVLDVISDLIRKLQNQ